MAKKLLLAICYFLALFSLHGVISSAYFILTNFENIPIDNRVIIGAGIFIMLFLITTIIFSFLGETFNTVNRRKIFFVFLTLNCVAYGFYFTYGMSGHFLYGLLASWVLCLLILLAFIFNKKIAFVGLSLFLFVVAASIPLMMLPLMDSYGRVVATSLMLGSGFSMSFLFCFLSYFGVDAINDLMTKVLPLKNARNN